MIDTLGAHSPYEHEEESGAPAHTSIVRAVLRTTEGRIGLGLSVFMILLVSVGRFAAPYPPDRLDVGPAITGPSLAHLLGTDDLGRDVLSRFLYGGATVLLLPLAAVTVSLVIGGGLGLLAAYRGGLADRVITRLFDVVLVIPALLLALVLIAGLGTSGFVVMMTVTLVYMPRLGRLVRGSARSVTSHEYILAAELRGESAIWILRREILPNVIGPVLSAYALYVTYAVIFVVTLSYLGFGAQPPSSNWGLMINEDQAFITFNVWATLAPAAGIAAMSVAFTLLADAVNRQLARGADVVGAGV